jgi:hypothetical protein
VQAGDTLALHGKFAEFSLVKHKKLVSKEMAVPARPKKQQKATREVV